MDIQNALYRLRELKSEQRDIANRLANEITKDKAVLDALRSGLVRLNFPAPSGFYKVIRNKQ